MKKYIGLILSFLMILSLSVPALAEENDLLEEIEQELDFLESAETEPAAAGSDATESAAAQNMTADPAVDAAFDDIAERLKAGNCRLIYTEGTDERILDAAARLKQEGIITPVLLGNVDEVRAAAARGGYDIEGLEIIDPASDPDMDKLVKDFVELRKGKATAEEAREMLLKPNYFGTMLVKEGLADSLLGGATYSTADTVRPALQLIKTREGANLVSSCMILIRDGEKLAMGDCAINVSYEDKLDDQGNVTLSAAQQVAEGAVETARTASLFGIEPKIAMLSGWR